MNRGICEKLKHLSHLLKNYKSEKKNLKKKKVLFKNLTRLRANKKDRNKNYR